MGDLAPVHQAMPAQLVPGSDAAIAVPGQAITTRQLLQQQPASPQRPLPPALTGDLSGQKQVQSPGPMQLQPAQPGSVPLTGNLRGQKQLQGAVSIAPRERQEPQVLTGDYHAASVRNAARDRALRMRRQGTIELAPAGAHQQEGSAPSEPTMMQPVDPAPPTSLLTTMNTDIGEGYPQERLPPAVAGDPIFYINPLQDVPPSPGTSYAGSPVVPFKPLGITEPRPGRIDEIQPVQGMPAGTAQVLSSPPTTAFDGPGDANAYSAGVPVPLQPQEFNADPATAGMGAQAALLKPPQRALDPGNSHEGMEPLPRKLTKRSKQMLRVVFEAWREHSVATATSGFYTKESGSRGGRHGGSSITAN